MSRTNEGTVLIEGARILFRNFSGKEGKYNREGERNFCVLLDDDIADQMAKDGWNIKTLAAREEDASPQPYIQVSVGFKVRPPKIFMITSRGRTALSEDECDLLDWVDIKTVDLIFRPYHWSVSGKSGIKPYLQSFFVTIEEDELELKYADIPEFRAMEELEGPSHPRVIQGTVVRGELEA